VGHQIKAGIQKKSAALPVLLPFNVKFLLGCLPMVLHEKIGKKSLSRVLEKHQFFSSQY